MLQSYKAMTDPKTEVEAAHQVIIYDTETRFKDLCVTFYHATDVGVPFGVAFY